MIATKLSDWNRGKLTRIFGLKRVKDHQLLLDWLDFEKESLTDFEQNYIEFLKTGLEEFVDIWNEIDLREQFIGPFIRIINFYGEHFRYFAGKKIAGEVGNYSISGEVDAMIAYDLENPTKPYFCFYEYKPEKEPNKHPFGQTLAAMLVAQEHNEHKFPIYGAYVMGRHWYFLILKGKEYAISRSYDASEDSIYEIFFILRKLKRIIEGFIQKEAKELIEV